jgi:rubrerythrin/predicted phosphodiesterase
VIGNPSSDGLGVECFQWFHAGLAGARGDFTIIPGDISPIGRDPYYRTVADFVDRSSSRPVHVMRGNHDGPDYEEYFGPSERAILTDEFTLIMLDNSSRSFSAASLNFLRETMAIDETESVVVSFHVPPPNRISGNSMSVDEWRRFEEAAGVWRKRIKLLVCGHSHSYFEDEIDGLRLVVTGGGGAAVREMERVVTPPHHAVEVTVEGGLPRVKMRPLVRATAAGLAGEAIHDLLREVYSIQCRHHASFCLDAEWALEEGMVGRAHLYRAAAESSYAQVRSLYRLLGREEVLEAVGTDYTVGLDDGGPREVVSSHALDMISRSEQAYAMIHDRMSDEPGAGEDIPDGEYWICGNCGMLCAGADSPNYCAACGAPGSRYRKVK